MRRLLGSVLPAILLASVLAGCGDEQPAVTDQPEPTSSAPTKGPSAGEAVDHDVVQVITETAAGGETGVGLAAVPLGDDAAVQQFTAQFTTEAMTIRVQDAVEQANDSEEMLLYGAVVAIGCDSPTEISVTRAGQALMLTAAPVASPRLECFAPMTTVALVLVPATAVS